MNASDVPAAAASGTKADDSTRRFTCDRIHAEHGSESQITYKNEISFTRPLLMAFCPDWDRRVEAALRSMVCQFLLIPPTIKYEIDYLEIGDCTRASSLSSLQIWSMHTDLSRDLVYVCLVKMHASVEQIYKIW